MGSFFCWRNSTMQFEFFRDRIFLPLHWLNLRIICFWELRNMYAGNWTRKNTRRLWRMNRAELLWSRRMFRSNPSKCRCLTLREGTPNQTVRKTKPKHSSFIDLLFLLIIDEDFHSCETYPSLLPQNTTTLTWKITRDFVGVCELSRFLISHLQVQFHHRSTKICLTQKIFLSRVSNLLCTTTSEWRNNSAMGLSAEEQYSTSCVRYHRDPHWTFHGLSVEMHQLLLHVTQKQQHQ